VNTKILLSGGESDTTSINFQKSEITTKGPMLFMVLTFLLTLLLSNQAQRKLNLATGESEERLKISDFFLASPELNLKI